MYTMHEVITEGADMERNWFEIDEKTNRVSSPERSSGDAQGGRNRSSRSEVYDFFVFAASVSSPTLSPFLDLQSGDLQKVA